MPFKRYSKHYSPRRMVFFFEAEKSVFKTRAVPLSACIFLFAEKANKKDTATNEIH